MPSRLGKAASAASLVNTTRCPRAPLGALSLATSSSVRQPSNGKRFGCPSTSANSTTIALRPNPHRTLDRLCNRSSTTHLQPQLCCFCVSSCHPRRGSASSVVVACPLPVAARNGVPRSCAPFAHERGTPLRAATGKGQATTTEDADPLRG